MVLIFKNRSFLPGLSWVVFQRAVFIHLRERNNSSLLYVRRGLKASALPPHRFSPESLEKECHQSAPSSPSEDCVRALTPKPALSQGVLFQAGAFIVKATGNVDPVGLQHPLSQGPLPRHQSPWHCLQICPFCCVESPEGLWHAVSGS